ncbi:hypothetical protein JAAARDRAFT_701836 [Jaapia argillacea MUCL 33604]|uniref:RING-type domain-containing protein n=1 Tax=Jaapia argillacea MUCL 33604 TaxID=933084 RepID=A0A067Q6Y4_9AGAM|nr:hypothetical protein JAAARDRAFT_701836 [Jaapia argillacea MUCL 33604]
MDVTPLPNCVFPLFCVCDIQHITTIVKLVKVQAKFRNHLLRIVLEATSPAAESSGRFWRGSNNRQQRFGHSGTRVWGAQSEMEDNHLPFHEISQLLRHMVGLANQAQQQLQQQPPPPPPTEQDLADMPPLEPIPQAPAQPTTTNDRELAPAEQPPAPFDVDMDDMPPLEPIPPNEPNVERPPRDDDEESMPNLASVSDSSEERDIREVEMMDAMEVVHDDGDSAWADESDHHIHPDPDVPPILEPIATLPTGGRRARVDDIIDEDDRPRSRQRTSGPSNTNVNQPPQPPQGQPQMPPNVAGFRGFGAGQGNPPPIDITGVFRHAFGLPPAPQGRQTQPRDAPAATSNLNTNAPPPPPPPAPAADAPDANPLPGRTAEYLGLAFTTDMNGIPVTISFGGRQTSGQPGQPQPAAGEQPQEPHIHHHHHDHGHDHPPPPAGFATFFGGPGGLFGDEPPPLVDVPEGGAAPGVFMNFLTALGMGGSLGIPEQEDPERAKRLIAGLEEVPVGLVKRLERVGGAPGASLAGTDGGSDVPGCAVCLDKLLDAEGDSFESLNTEAQTGDRAVDAQAGETGEQKDEKQSPKIVVLPCAHVFHASCLLPWFSRPRQTTCPTCRFNIDPDNLTYRHRRRAAAQPQPPQQQEAPAQPQQQPPPQPATADGRPPSREPTPVGDAPPPIPVFADIPPQQAQPHPLPPAGANPPPQNANPTANANTGPAMFGGPLFTIDITMVVDPITGARYVVNNRGPAPGAVPPRTAGPAPPPPTNNDNQPPPNEPPPVYAGPELPPDFGADGGDPIEPTQEDYEFAAAMVQQMLGGPGGPFARFGRGAGAAPMGANVDPPAEPTVDANPPPPPTGNANPPPPPAANPLPPPNRSFADFLNARAHTGIPFFAPPPMPAPDARPRRSRPREKRQWILPPPPGPTLRQRVEQKEREAGLRCDDVSCGLGPSDEDPIPSVDIASLKQVSIHPLRSGEDQDVAGRCVCAHKFHPACLVTAERIAGWGGSDDKDSMDDEKEPEVEVSCPVCRAIGWVAREEWEDGVRALA